MKILILTALLFWMPTAKAQPSISIEYIKTMPGPADSVINELLKSKYPPDMRMVINDSFSIAYFISKLDKKLYRKKVIGDKLIHHGQFTNYITGETFSQSGWPKDKVYLMRFDSTMIPKWEMIEGEKTILNYSCKAVRSINKNHATTTVWYTTEMKFKRGDLFYPGVPGVVMEAYDYGWGSYGQYLRAVSVKETSQILTAPVNYKIFSFAEAVKN
jgi:GLPGLI family protein